MTKSRRVMAVIVVALLIVAIILPGLAVKAEAEEGEGTGEAGRAAAKVTIESKDNKTLQYKPGESQKWTLVITNKTGQDLSNLSVSPDMAQYIHPYTEHMDLHYMYLNPETLNY